VILYGPSLPSWPASVLVDKTLIESLVSRGAKVVGLYCDSVQIGPCSVADDKWIRGSFAKACNRCRRSSELLWHDSEATRFSEFISTKEVLDELKIAKRMSVHDIETFSEADLHLGNLARSLTLNGLMVEEPLDEHEYASRLRIHFANLRCARKAIRGALEKVRPHRVVSNDSHYGMWAIMQHEANVLGIPFYCQYPVSSDRVSFASNKPVIWADLRASFETFKNRDLTEFEISQVANWSSGNRRSTRTKQSGTLAQLSKNSRVGARTALLMTNAPWDLASMDRQAVFSSMFEWVRETIEWFTLNPQFTLYIRTHPVDRNVLVPKSPLTVEDMIANEFSNLPQNVIVLPPELDGANVADLVDSIAPSIAIVHTSTAALHCANKGVQVVATGYSPYRGFGFTTDPKNRQEYFESIEAALSKPAHLNATQLDLAMKFISYYQFRYHANAFIQTGTPTRLSTGLARSLGDSRSPLNHAVETIYNGEQFHNSDNWSPNY
jgi:hypothetical protein